jgi:hypothetical protein
MPFRNTQWSKYEPVYAGAPTQELLQSLSTMDAKHWANLKEKTRLESALTDMQFAEADKPEAAKYISGLQQQIQELSSQPSLARSGNQLNDIMRSVVANPELKGMLKNKMYIDAKKADIQQKYESGYFDKERRDAYMQELNSYSGVTIDDYGMFEPYTYEGEVKSFDYDAFEDTLYKNFNFDSSTTSSETAVEDREIRGDVPYLVRGVSGKKVTITPAEDYLKYYKERLEDDPDAMADIREKARIRNVSEDSIKTEILERAKEKYYGRQQIKSWKDIDRLDLTKLTETPHTIYHKMTSAFNLAPDKTTLKDYVNDTNDKDEVIVNAVMDSKNSVDNVYNDAYITDSERDMLFQVFDNLALPLDKYEELYPNGINIDYFRERLSDETYKRLYPSLSYHIGNINTNRLSQQGTAKNLERIIKEVLQENNISDITEAEFISKYKDFIEGHKDELREKYPDIEYREQEEEESDAMYSYKEGMHYLTNWFARAVNPAYWYRRIKGESDIFPDDIAKEVNKRLKENAEPVSLEFNTFLLPTDDDAGKEIDSNVRQSLFTELGTGHFAVHDLKTGKSIPSKDRKNWDNLAMKAMPIRVFKGQDGKVGVVVRPMGKDADGNDLPQDKHVVTYDLSDALTPYLISRGYFNNEVFEFSRNLDAMLRNGHADFNGISVRRVLNSDIQRDPHLAGYMYLVTYRDLHGNIIQADYPLDNESQVYSEVVKYTNLRNSKLQTNE